jgi:hypothetical protein
MNIDGYKRLTDADIDGFNLAPIRQPGSFIDFVELVVPELQRRGLRAHAHEGTKLREHLFGAGHKCLPPDHSAYRLADIDLRARDLEAPVARRRGRIAILGARGHLCAIICAPESEGEKG